MPRALPLLLLLAAGSLARAQPEVEVRGHLTLHVQRGVLKGRVVLRLKNTGKTPLASFPLVLYGARFQALDPRISDLNFDRYYVRRFHPGAMTLDSVRSLEGAPLTVASADPLLVTPVVAPAVPEEAKAQLPPGTVVRVQLERPVPPGRWAGVEVAFTTRIPERLGTFGRHGDRVTLEAGALPYVPAANRSGLRSPSASPARTRFDLTLRVDSEADAAPPPALLEGTLVRGTQRLRFVGHSPFVAAGDELAPLVDVLGTPRLPRVQVFGAAGEQKRARRLVRLAHDVARYLRDEWLPENAPPFGPLTLVEAPLRDRFVAVADRVVLVSDRALEVFVLLQRFHELEVLRGVALALIRERLSAVPLGADRDWVAEAIAWRVIRGYVKRQAGLKGEKLAGLLDFFSFIPTVDRLLRAPRFTGSDLFYGRAYEPRDAVPDAFARALSDRARGRVLAEKLLDKLGPERLQQLFAGLLGAAPPVAGARVLGPGDVRGQAAQLIDRDLSGFFALWLNERQVLQNLSFKSLETLAEHEDGSATVRVTIAREGDARVGEVGEPVVVEGQDAAGKRVRAVWDGFGMEGRVVLRHDGGLLSPLRLDPAGRVYQTNTGDDVRPRFPFKVLLNRFRVRIDLNRGKKNEAALGFTFHPNHDYRHAILLDGAYAQDERGLNLGYGVGFGKVIDQRSYGAGLSLRATAAKLNEGVLQNDALVQETEGDLISFGAGLGFDTRIDRRNPTWGIKAGVGVDYSDRILGTDFRFTQYRASLGFVYSIVRGTQLAGEVEAGLTDGNRIPSQRLFDAGGEGNVRGVETGKFVGKAYFVIRGELRQMLFEDLNVPLLWLAWLRKVQAVVFLDSGDVGDDLGDVYDARTDWKWGTGFGFRFWIDAFGVTTITARFDVGFRIDETDELGPEFYLGVGQNF